MRVKKKNNNKSDKNDNKGDGTLSKEEMPRHRKDCSLNGYHLPAVNIAQEIENILCSGKPHTYATCIYDAVKSLVEMRIMAEQQP